ncbi:polysaccharide biosynthesis/export family protein, partial [Rhodoferax sp. OV413]|uniref:polysaccharide biosynthesis/export family protein n=1 Tax=Rhodoferax sp. OV413 TaxID=1855285 RepID=UPI0025FDE24C
MTKSLVVAALISSFAVHAQPSPSGVSQATAAPSLSDGVAAPAFALPSLGAKPPIAASELSAPAQSTDELNRVLSRARGTARDEAPSQFQKFVQEATGALLPNFGSQLFDAPQNYVPDAGLAAPSNYVLGPGDEVRIQVWGATDFSAGLTLDRDGKISLPKVGVLTLAGVSVANLEQVLKGHLSKVFTNFGLNASLGKLRSVQVYVVGQARQPGTYAVSSLSTLVNVLFVSGGPNSNGSMRAIELQRGGKVLTRLDLYNFIAKGDKSADMVVQPGDVIFIPPATRRVAVTGAYDQAAIYELSDRGSTVGDILSLAGGASPVANTRKALLERVDADKVPPRLVLDISLDAKGLNQSLASGDILTLLPVSPAFANAVTLQGVVAEPLRYRWFEGMKILDLIPDREALIKPSYYKDKNQLTLPKNSVSGMDLPKNAGSGMGAAQDEAIESRFRSRADQVNWDTALIERMSQDKFTKELIPFNLGKAVLQRDPASNLSLKAGDVVTILSHKDLAVPMEKQSRLVRVEGEVAAPGLYNALPGETLPQLVKRIGGLSAQAYLYGSELNRESVRLRQQENLDSLVRRLESSLQGRTKTGNANGQDAAAAAILMQQEQSQIQSQINKLKSLKSNGRLALEMDPAATTIAGLPNLPLEDGDRFFVP